MSNGENNAPSGIEEAVRALLRGLLAGGLRVLSPGPACSRVHRKPPSGWIYAPHDHRYPETVALVRGSARLITAHRVIVLRPGRIWTILPGVTHCECFRDRRRGYALLWVICTRGHVSFFVSVYTPGAGGRVESRLVIEHDGPAESGPPASQGELAIQSHWLAALAQWGLRALEAARQPPTAARGYQRTVVDQVRGYLDSHYREDVSLRELGQLARCSPNYLNALFRRHAGVPVHRYLLEKRLTRAAQLLREGTPQVKQVAYETGFRDPLYFSKLFRRRFGHSPSVHGPSSPG